jgi:hypothetical protein
MIWLTWRQFRTQVAAIYAALAAVAVVLAATGGQLADLSRTSSTNFLDLVAADRTDKTLYFFGIVAVVVLPGIIGVFWGAPLVARELDAGTQRLAWNQTVTRTRWLAIKLGLTGLAAMAAAGLLSLAVSWWAHPIDKAAEAGQAAQGGLHLSRLAPVVFDARGIAPIGYAAFAFVLGVTVGIVLRRTVPAMAVTLALFVVVQIAAPALIRPHLLTPVKTNTTITTDNFRGMEANVDMRNGRPVAIGGVRNLLVEIDAPGAWILSNKTVDAAGKVAATLPSWVGTCMGPPPAAPDPVSGIARAPAQEQRARDSAEQACFARLAKLGYRQRVTYLPAARFGALQRAETAIFLAFTALLAGFCFWRLRAL